MLRISTPLPGASFKAEVPVRPISTDNAVCSTKQAHKALVERPKLPSQRVLAALVAKPTRRASCPALRPPCTVSSPALPARSSPPLAPQPVKWARFDRIVCAKLEGYLQCLGEDLLAYSGVARPDKVADLLLRGAPIDSIDELGRTPLHLACLTESELSASEEELRDEPFLVLGAVRLLLKHGADVHAADETRNTPLHLAATRPFEAVLTELIRAGADVNMRNEIGMTPLHMSIVSDIPSNCELLLLAGAEINARDAEGRTALHLAVLFSDVEILALLLNHPHVDLSVQAPSPFSRYAGGVAWLTAREEAQSAGLLSATNLLKEAERCLAASEAETCGTRLTD